MASQLTGCPKHMQYGPCAGVALDGSCEVLPDRCVFLDLPTVRWAAAAPINTAPVTGAVRLRALLTSRPVLVADFPARALNSASIAECAALLSGRVDAVLAGDSPAERVQFSPSYRAQLIHSTGLEVWAGVNCRDRNRVALEGELAGLADLGVAAVHCVTGDHTLTGQRPDALPVFDLDSTELAALAARAGHLVSVGESPVAPPVGRRAERLLEKMRAGAEVCFVNHCGSGVADFVHSAQDLGAQLHFIPCIPVVVDRASAEQLASFPTLVLPAGYLERILRASDPFAEGIAAAVSLGRDFLLIDGVSGLNLSGGPGPGREAWFADALGQIAEQLAAEPP